MDINDCFLKHNILIMAPQSKRSPLKITIHHNYAAEAVTLSAAEETKALSQVLQAADGVSG